MYRMDEPDPSAELSLYTNMNMTDLLRHSGQIILLDSFCKQMPQVERERERERIWGEMKGGGMGVGRYSHDC